MSLPGAGRRSLARPGWLDAQVDPQHGAQRQVLVRPRDCRVLRGDLERGAGDGERLRTPLTVAGRCRGTPASQAHCGRVPGEALTLDRQARHVTGIFAHDRSDPARLQPPLGATRSWVASTFGLFRRRHRPRAVALRSGRRPYAGAGHCTRSGQHRTYHYWHAFVRIWAPANSMRGGRTARPSVTRLRFDPSKVLLDPTAEGSSSPPATTGRPRGTGRRRRRRNEERGRRSVHVRLGRRRAAPASVLADGDLRDARRRLHPAPELRRRRREAGTYAGLIEKSRTCRISGYAVELLPSSSSIRRRAAGRTNYWGYAPWPSSRPTWPTARAATARPVDEFRTWSRPCTGRASR